MIIDFNTYVGNWPFRRLPVRSAEELLKLMDTHGIDVAAVSSLNSTLYIDVHEGNLELLEEIKNHKGRFIPLAVLNPKYPGWKDDLDECIDNGFKGIRLYPQYHNYSLNDDECLELVKRAAELNLSISIPIRLRDRRGRHWMDRARDIELQEVERLASKLPVRR
ncbi:MAG: amidohydrolase family protein [Thermoproteota archaeon]